MTQPTLLSPVWHSLSDIMHEPLTGIFLIAEITGGYVLMVPLMVTSAIPYAINRSDNQHSIHTKPLAEKGELLSHEDKDSTVLTMMKLRYLIEKDDVILKSNDQLSNKMGDILQSKRNVFPVLDDANCFKGLVYIEDILKDSVKIQQSIAVSDLMQQAPYTVTPATNVKAVLEIMEKENVWVLPVLNAEGEFLGFVSKIAIFNKY
ncbi:CBS domain-containing protein [Pedobacter sp. JCM 36344]|uniref:CBS domain-containing protein n=1 Tax=Pedobacter sp. JCM 36344 TaxID=3374280 RepID=UPI0039784B1E